MIKARDWGFALGVCAAVVLLAPTARAQGPSFNCAKAQGAIERTICASAELSADDRLMAQLYAAARVSAFGTGPSSELAAQRSALRQMQDCAKPAGNQTSAQCLHRAYAGRNNDLAIAALIGAPGQALPVLRRTDPAYAPILEAVAIWAGEPRGADWSVPARAGKRARVLELLRPAITDMLTRDDEAFPREILADPSNGGVTVKRAEDVLISERHFAAFLNVLGPYISDDDWPARGDTGRRNLPCAAILRHPALLGATGSVFGSTLDNFVLGNDCDETLPPLPALDALSAKLIKAWPQCDGTIRFAAYRVYESSLDAARLGLARHDPKVKARRRRGIAPGDVAAARSGLAAYYATYLGKPPSAAAAMAEDALTAIFASAQECD